MNTFLRKLTITALAAIPAAAVLAGPAGAASPNKLENGDFGTGSAGWAVTPSGAASFGSLWGVGALNNEVDSSLATTVYAHQCVPVTGNVKYKLSGRSFLLPNQDRSGSSNMSLQFYAEPDCTSYLSSSATPTVGIENAWSEQEIEVTAPEAAKSVRVRLNAHKHAALWLIEHAEDPFLVFFDDISLVQTSFLFPGIIKIPTPGFDLPPIVQIPPSVTPVPPTVTPVPPTVTPVPPTVTPVPPTPVVPTPVVPTPIPPTPADPTPVPPSSTPVPPASGGDSGSGSGSNPGSGTGSSSDSGTGSSNPGSGSSSGSGSNSSSGSSEGASTGQVTGATSGDTVQTMGSAGQQPAASNGKAASAPSRNASGSTPAAPGNATSTPGFLSTTGLAFIAGASLSGLALALLALARTRRRPEYDESQWQGQ